MQYRRNYTEGGSYFFTVNLAERKRRLLVEHIDALREAIRIARARHPFQIDAMVVMPDHLHAVFTLPSGDADYPTRWMLIKAGFSRNIPKTERINTSRRSNGERGIWQRRFWEHTIQNEDDFRHHIDYIHYNPVTSRAQRIGYIPASIDTSKQAYCPPIGAQPPPKTTKGLGSVGWGEARTPTRQPLSRQPNIKARHDDQ